MWKGNSPAFGPLKLTSTGGHPGTQPNIAVIRRWVAPCDTTINISGRLEHQLDDEAKAIYDKQFSDGLRKWFDKNAWDGVTGIIVWSRMSRGTARIGKELWRYNVLRDRRDANYGDINVKRGDTIDFIVTSRNYMKPKLRQGIALKLKINNPQQDNFTWNPTVRIKKEVAEPRMWKKYVQVLLLSNELAYVD